MKEEPYLYLSRPHRKVEIAFLMSMKMIFESSRKCYFWTLTPAWAMGDNRFARAVNSFCKKFGNAVRDELGQEKAGWPPGFMAIRVFEPFKSGFLHCHFVCNMRLPAKMVWRIAAGTGIGRVDVRRCNPGVADYLCKYLRKEHVLPGLRTWAKWGNWEHVRVNNVEVDSQETRLLKWCRIQAAYEKRTSFSWETGRVYHHFVKKPKGQAWVDARTLFFVEQQKYMRDRNVKFVEIGEDGQYYRT